MTPEEIKALSGSVENIIAKIKAMKTDDEIIKNDLIAFEKNQTELLAFVEAAKENEKVYEENATKLNALERKISAWEEREKVVERNTDAIVAELKKPENTKAIEAIASAKQGTMEFKINAATMDIDNTIGDNPTGPAVVPYRRSEPVDVRRKGREVFDAIQSVNIDTSTIWEDYEAGDNGVPVFVGADDAAPEMDVNYATKAYHTQTVKGYSSLNEKMMRVVSYVRAKVETIIRRKLIIEVTKQLLDGDNTGENLWGLRQQGVAFSADATQLVPGELGILTATNKIEILNAGKLQVQNAFFEPDIILMQNADLLVMKMRKDNSGRFDGQAQSAELVSMAVPNQYVGSGNFIIMDSSVPVKYIQEDINVALGYINDDFIRNRLSIRINMDLALVINPNEIEAVVFGDFTTAAADLNAE